MTEVKPAVEAPANIKVVGVGGSGGNAINRMMEGGIRGVEFIAINTDIQDLNYNKSPLKIHIGKTITKGLGAGMNPDLGRDAAAESQNEIRDALKGADMVFITCGLGGGTGTGASPIIAELARDLGALTIAVVTKPFTFEGVQRRKIAERGQNELIGKVDAIITIPNDRIFQVIDKKTTILEAFGIVDDVLRQGVQGIAEIINTPALINVDFADVKSIMVNAGSTLMGIGQASGENRAIEAAKAAISSPLLEMSIDGAKGILFTITGGPSLALDEVHEAAKIITNAVDEEAKIIFGTTVDNNFKDEVRVTVIAAGFDNPASAEGEATNKTFNSFYKPTSFVEKNQPDSGTEVRESHKGFMSALKKAQAEPAKPAVAPEMPESPEGDGDDDLSIPAFLRKKIM
ncbi:MAG TPA: cell division protein FtsZ [bacterium]|jgi:cell division protein FtsZ|nr:cell division protein FtsZ [bacterium]HOR69156.1 cell division protein FtsZ [bacterium]HPL83306.1 cell division protein FtsZ [bacterium]